MLRREIVDKVGLPTLFVVQFIISQIVIFSVKDNTLGTDREIIGFIFTLSFYILIFHLPVLIYLTAVDKVNPFIYLKLNNKVLSGIIKGIFIGCFIFLVFLLKSKSHAIRQVSLPQDIFILLGKVLVGPLEEIPFRGFYLQKVEKYMSFSKANVLSTVLFALMHINVLSGSIVNLLYSLVYISVIGLWMGYIFKKTQSIWSSAIVHSLYDISVWLFM